MSGSESWGWVWACAHGLWIAGPITAVVVIVGMALDRGLTRGQLLRLVSVPAGAILAAGLTPVGPRLLALPFTIRGYGEYVAEWATPSVTDPTTLATLALGLAALLVWLRRSDTTRWSHIALWCLGMLWTLSYDRTVALGAVTLALVAAPSLATIVPTAALRVSARREWSVIAAGIAAASLAGLVWGGSLSQPAGIMSPALEARVEALPAHTVVFNDYGLGGWILFANPGADPVIDGRADVYSLDYFVRYTDAISAKPGWQRTVTDTGASIAVLERTWPLTGALRDQLGWTVQAQDTDYVILRAPGS